MFVIFTRRPKKRWRAGHSKCQQFGINFLTGAPLPIPVVRMTPGDPGPQAVPDRALVMVTNTFRAALSDKATLSIWLRKGWWRTV